jgi:hypothetical protein
MLSAFYEVFEAKRGDGVPAGDGDVLASTGALDSPSADMQPRRALDCRLSNTDMLGPDATPSSLLLCVIVTTISRRAMARGQIVVFSRLVRPLGIWRFIVLSLVSQRVISSHLLPRHNFSIRTPAVAKRWAVR